MEFAKGWFHYKSSETEEDMEVKGTDNSFEEFYMNKMKYGGWKGEMNSREVLG